MDSEDTCNCEVDMGALVSLHKQGRCGMLVLVSSIKSGPSGKVPAALHYLSEPS